MKFFKYLINAHTIAIVGTAALTTGCLEQGYGIKSANTSVSAVTVASPTATPAGVTTSTAITFKTLKPALAVRGASCLMCHAQVNANVISDFGYGDTWFFDHDNSDFLNGNGPNGGIYGDWYESGSIASGSSAWGAGVIQGSLYVPKVSMDHTYPIVTRLDPNNQKSTMSLASVIAAKRLDSTGAVVQPAMSAGISPPAGTAAVVEKSKIVISAPKESEILALAPTLTAAGFQAIAVNGITPNTDIPLSGLTVVKNSTGSYTTNSGTLSCAGDVVVRGTLFLNALKLKTDANGCRLYVSGSVFLQGAVTYASTNPTTANLQITSAKMIGLGFNVTSLGERLSINGDRTYIMPRYKTRSGLAPTDLHNSFMTEANTISSLMVDAGDSASTNLNPITGVLLNAPEVHSRYTGNFNGAVVAEIAVFRLTQFIFTFDSVFQTVPILPALTNDILSITD